MEVQCLRCRGYKRQFASASALRRHTSHRHLRNSECAEQRSKNPRLLISSWKPGPAHRSDGTVVEDENAALVLAGDDLIASILLADNADEPADAAPSQVTLSLRVSFKSAGPGAGSVCRALPWPLPTCVDPDQCRARRRAARVPGPTASSVGPAGKPPGDEAMCRARRRADASRRRSMTRHEPARAGSGLF